MCEMVNENPSIDPFFNTKFEVRKFGRGKQGILLTNDLNKQRAHFICTCRYRKTVVKRTTEPDQIKQGTSADRDRARETRV